MIDITKKDLGAAFDSGDLVKIAADGIAVWDASDWEIKYELASSLGAVCTVLRQDPTTNRAFTLVHCPAVTPSVFWTHTMLLVRL